MELIAHPRYEDYKITYHGLNRWGFLGNGWSARDYDGSDPTWFWGLVDGEDRKQEDQLEWNSKQDEAETVTKSSVEDTVPDFVDIS
jgi:hypothetical protein